MHWCNGRALSDRKQSAEWLGPPPWVGLPGELAEMLHPDIGDLVEELLDAVRTAVPNYDRPDESAFGTNMRAGVERALYRFVDLVRDGGDVGPELKSLYYEFGRWEAREGGELESLLAAYRLGARLSWRRIAERISGEGLGEETVARLAEAVFAYIDEISAFSAEGFVAEREERAGERDRRRRQLLRLLCGDGPADPAAIELAAHEAGWELPRTLAVIVYEQRDPDRLAARLPHGSLASTIDELGVAVVDDPDGPGRWSEIAAAVGEQPAAIGSVVSWREAHRSAERARIAFGLRRAGRLGETTGLLVADEHLATLIAHDSPLVDDLAARRLAPLAGRTDGARARLEATLLAWLDAHGNVKATAATLEVHPQTVRYRMAQLRELFGSDLESPDARFELLLVLRSRRTRA